jgi:hypothetical protein
MAVWMIVAGQVSPEVKRQDPAERLRAAPLDLRFLKSSLAPEASAMILRIGA